ncbi:CDP-glucose 4,6-dehydratase [Bosea minatitlanensis]|uniref:CDP-glucose 4,6-dehydratase n=1 Tax=Bosea minatitlanensis TaxID=128782 RepID=A0ABW0F7H3_9HYPH|nr:CDP-glucose 4,6-dehydratase [Bosea minatitlanensis]MCT4495492.1 CDP-glucose 4,6-dehydratase [Bosea minatitlanensis]
MLNRSFWQGRKVFLTGHTGFKGAWLSLWLEALGADVTGYALDPPSEPSLFVQARVGECIRSIRGDVRDLAHLQSAIAACDPDIVIHMAAQSVVRRSYDEPVETYATNLMGTVHLLEAVRRRGRPCVVVNVTSDKCYENREWVWGYRESDPMGGHDPYSSSKGCAELATKAYRDSYFAPEALSRHGVALASARAGNAIGGGDWTADQLIPDLIRAFLDRRPCRIRNPGAIRPWQFVLMPLHGYLLLCERLAEDGAGFASGWNFGPAEADARPVSWIADRLVASWGEGASWTQDGAAHPAEAQLLRLDTSRARALLGWRPVLQLDQSLLWIVEWYEAFQAGQDLQSLTRRQIERYEYLLQDDAETSAQAARRRMKAAAAPLLSAAEG